jgi:stage V sporulation protein SpoVS
MRRRVAGVVAFALFAGALGYLTGNEVQAGTQFDRTHAALDSTRHHVAVTLAALATVRTGLDVVDGQVNQGHVALARDTTQLQGVQTALAGARADVSHQTQGIAELQACLSGVEQALNALAVGDRVRAIDALDAVTASCSAAVATDG